MAAVCVHANMVNVMKDYKILLNDIEEITLLEMKCWNVEIKRRDDAR